MIPKVRAWVKEEQKMFDVEMLVLSLEGELEEVGVFMSKEPIHTRFFDAKEVVLMQSTGLTDKNGVEIYEGDIVKATRKLGVNIEKDDLLEVYWNKNLCHFGLTINRGGYLKHSSKGDWATLTARKAEYLEVVGNIYEHPELLKEVGK